MMIVDIHLLNIMVCVCFFGVFVNAANKGGDKSAAGAAAGAGAASSTAGSHEK